PDLGRTDVADRQLAAHVTADDDAGDADVGEDGAVDIHSCLQLPNARSGHIDREERTDLVHDLNLAVRRNDGSDEEPHEVEIRRDLPRHVNREVHIHVPLGWDRKSSCRKSNATVPYPVWRRSD